MSEASPVCEGGSTGKIAAPPDVSSKFLGEGQLWDETTGIATETRPGATQINDHVMTNTKTPLSSESAA